MERTRQVDLLAGPLDSTATEEQILSAMLSGKSIRSLLPENFTSPSRKLIYAALSNGYGVDQLPPSLKDEALDIWYRRPLLPHSGIIDAVDELKRLALIRPLCERVEEWLKRAPSLGYQAALSKLKEAIRG